VPKKCGLISTLIIAWFKFRIPGFSVILIRKFGRSGDPICSNVSLIHLDLSSILCSTVMTDYTCSICVVVSAPCGSSSFLAYHGSALVMMMMIAFIITLGAMMYFLLLELSRLFLL